MTYQKHICWNCLSNMFLVLKNKNWRSLWIWTKDSHSRHMNLKIGCWNLHQNEFTKTSSWNWSAWNKSNWILRRFFWSSHLLGMEWAAHSLFGGFPQSLYFLSQPFHNPSRISSQPFPLSGSLPFSIVSGFRRNSSPSLRNPSYFSLLMFFLSFCPFFPSESQIFVVGFIEWSIFKS